MKKIALICLLIIAVCLLSAGTAFADTQASGGQTFYIANENLTVYVASGEGYQAAFVIPKTYYFRTLSNNGNYTSIVYNKNTDYGISLYVMTSDLENKAAVTKDAVTDEKAYYNIPVADVVLSDKNSTNFYKPDNLIEYNTKGENISEIRRILGVYQYGNEVYFSAVVNVNSTNKLMLFKATETNRADFTLASIPLHEITIDKNNAQNEGVISTPGGSNTDVTGNNVIRNVMIAVICILCVLVVFLIFRPTKNAKNRYEMDNRENADRGYDDYDPRYGDRR